MKLPLQNIQLKTLIKNGVQIKFNKVIEFKQADTGLSECFFFNDGQIVATEFLTLDEFNLLNNQF